MFISNSVASFLKAYGTDITKFTSDTIKMKETYILSHDKELKAYLKILVECDLLYWIAEFYSNLEEKNADRFKLYLWSLSENERKLCDEYRRVSTENQMKVYKNPLEDYYKDRDSIGSVLNRLIWNPHNNDEEKKKWFGILISLWEKMSSYHWDDVSKNRIYAECLRQCVDTTDMVLMNEFQDNVSIGIPTIDTEWDDADEYYKVLTGRISNYSIVNDKKVGIRNFVEKVPEFKEIGKYIIDTVEQADDIIRSAFDRDDESRLFYQAALSCFNVMGYEEFAKFLIRYYDRIGNYKEALCMDRMFVKTVMETKDIRLATSLMGAFIYDKDKTVFRVNKIRDEAKSSINEMTDIIESAVREYKDRYKELGYENLEDIIWGDYIKQPEFWEIIRGLDENCRKEFINALSLKKLWVYLNNIRWGIDDMKHTLLPQMGKNQQILLWEKHNYLIKLTEKMQQALKDERQIKWRDGRRRLEREFTEHVEKLVLENMKNSLRELQAEIEKMRSCYKDSDGDEKERILQDALEKYEKRTKTILDEVGNILNITGITERQDYMKFEMEIREIIGEQEKEDLMSTRLENDVKEKIKDELFTSAQVFFLLGVTKKEQDEPVDFSVAILPLTKTLELVVNALFARIDIADIKHNLINADKNNFYLQKDENSKNGPRIKRDSIDLGTGARLFLRNNVDCNLGVCDWWNHNGEYADFSVLSKLSGMSVKRYVDFRNKDYTEIIESFERYGNDGKTDAEIDEENIDKLCQALIRIAYKYRNPVAHTEFFEESGYDACKKELISEYKLLWVVLAMMKPVKYEL